MFKLNSFPIRLFLLMFATIFLLNLNFTILRSVRNTLAIADVGGNAASIPYFELLGVLPAACVMTWLLGRFLRSRPLRTVFLITLFAFIGFFLLFSSLLYPWLKEMALGASVQEGSLIVLKGCSMLFYVIAELWKPALMHILFWGLVNLNLPMDRAKQLYPALMLASSLGSMFTGVLITGCTSQRMWEIFPLSSNQWGHSFISMMLLVFLIGVVTALLYHRLSSLFEKSATREVNLNNASLSFGESIKTCLSSPSLKWMCWIVLADYMAYSLGEVIFLEVLKQKFADPCDYCRYMGDLATWSSLLTVVSALFFAPLCLKRCRWVVSALVLPVALLLIEGAFFIFLRVESLSSHLFGWSHNEWVGVVVILGTLQFCACRAIKYTFFDASKELAFVALPKLEQIKGKLIIDGVCARLGRGSASALSLTFITCSGGILASSLVSGVAAIGFTATWVIAVLKLGKKERIHASI